MVPHRNAVYPVVDAVSGSKKPPSVSVGHVGVVGARVGHLRFCILSHCTQFPARWPSRMDCPFGGHALRFDCIDFLGRIAIPLSGRRLVHYFSQRGRGLYFETYWQLSSLAQRLLPIVTVIFVNRIGVIGPRCIKRKLAVHKSKYVLSTCVFPTVHAVGGQDKKRRRNCLTSCRG